MGLIAKEGGGSFKPVPPGAWTARCYQVIDLGTQVSKFDNKEQHKIRVQFEVHDKDKGGRPLVTAKGEPMTISKNYTLSLNSEATLRKDLVSWRGRDFTRQELDGFELKNILDKWATILVKESIGADNKSYSNITGISPVDPAVKAEGLPAPHNKAQYFDLDNPDMELFETFSQWTQAAIKSTKEWKRREYETGENQSGADRYARQGSGFDDMKDDNPF